jgi:hypothetical protein
MVELRGFEVEGKKIKLPHLKGEGRGFAKRAMIQCPIDKYRVVVGVREGKGQ